MPRRSVIAGKEFRRVQNLPTRDPEPDPALAAILTAHLKTYAGTQSLRPIQAQALYEIGKYRRLLGPIRVGAGKTLISLLAARILESRAPILLVPASLVEKTRRDIRELAVHWQIPRNLRIESYEKLGTVGGSRILEVMKPDCIIADEVHCLKNRKAGRTRRVLRYMKEHPETVFIAISGTLIRNSLKDFAHIAQWTHGDESPVPIDDNVLEEWANALDAKVNPLSRVDPGALGSDVDDARKRFQDRLLRTPGVVATSLGEDVACSLYISALVYEVSPVTEEHFKRLRTLWERPDGFALSEAVDVWRVARQLALGLHYEWNPNAPEEWLARRRVWAKFVRETLSRSRHLDTELQVANACDAGELDPTYLNAWREIRDTFKPNPVPVWHDDSALVVCEKWLSKNEGIVWTLHDFFAEELSRRTGIPYFGAEGLTHDGRYIGDAKGSIIASIAANGTGKNLQTWEHNLVTCPVSEWEQLLGRTHRPGQMADAVTCDVLMACMEHETAWEQALEAARMIHDTQGHEQKILSATVDMDVPREYRKGYRWHK